MKKRGSPAARDLKREKTFREMFEKFLKFADKKKVVEPPTYLEKALIVGRPVRAVKKTPMKAILPEVIEKKKMKKK